MNRESEPRSWARKQESDYDSASIFYAKTAQQDLLNERTHTLTGAIVTVILNSEN